MTRDEVLKIISDSKTADSEILGRQVSDAFKWLEGYEQGVRDSAKVVENSHIPHEGYEYLLEDKVLSLLSDGKKGAE